MKPALALAALAPLTLALAACGKQPAPQPTASATPTTPVVAEPTLPAPDETIFAETFAGACPSAKTVSTSSCRSAGMGKPEFLCQYGLGDDHYLRYDATLAPGDDKWTLVDPDKTCAQGA